MHDLLTFERGFIYRSILIYVLIHTSFRTKKMPCPLLLSGLCSRQSEASLRLLRDIIVLLVVCFCVILNIRYTIIISKFSYIYKYIYTYNIL